jgi:hypothetical protein
VEGTKPNPILGGEAQNPKVAFEAFTSFVAQFDPIDLLSQLTLTFLFTQETNISESSNVRLWARWIEFAAGYLATRSSVGKDPLPFHGNSIERFEILLKEYFDSFFVHFLTNQPSPSHRSPADDLLMSAKIHSMYIRGDAYPHQFLEYASELYGQHDKWFNSNLGFNIDQAIRIVRSVPIELERRVNQSASNARMDAPRRAEELLRAGEGTGLSRPELESRIACQLHFGTARQLLSFTVEDLAAISGVEITICKSFLKRMSQSFGYRNPLFPDTFVDAMKAPWDYNCLDERPFIEHQGKYWLFTNSMLSSVIFYTFYFDLMDDRDYRPTFEATRGAFVELKVKDYAARIFPKDTILLNPAYSNGEEFSDVAVLYDGKVLIFECKAKSFTRSARIGEDFDRLRADLQAGIRVAFDQALRARKYIRDSATAILRSGRVELQIDTKQITDIYLINVTFMPFQAMATRFENNEEALGLFPEREYPLSMSLGDLDIVSQLLDSPARFLHYVNRRLSVEKTTFELHGDELDLLGFYLAQGMYFTSEEFRDANSLMLSGFSDEIDAYVHRKYDKHEQVERPKAPMPTGFTELINDIESLRSMYRTDCGIALLDMGGQARANIMEQIEAAKSATRSDGKQHSVSIGAPEHSRGLSFVSVGDAHSVSEVFDIAFGFASLKKYSERYGEWFGLGWQLGSSRSVDAALMLKFAWEENAEMDAAVQELLRPGRRISLGPESPL